MKTVSIIGFGRFGKILYRLLKDDFIITVYRRNPLTSEDRNLLGKTAKFSTDLTEVYKSEVIFFAVPISSFDSVIKQHKKYFQEEQLLVDVLSVKIHPKNVFEKYLKNSKTQFLLTHPMFGPDSSKGGFTGLPLILSKGTVSPKNYVFWRKYFTQKGIRVVEIEAEAHDKLAANSQGLTHFIGRLLEEMRIQKGPIDSLGTVKLLEIEEQTCNDTWQLFTDLQHYNPYTKQMRSRLGEAYDKLYNKLLPKQLNKNYITYGIQGGKGSFNEEAILYFLDRDKITNYKIKYLYTSENVLEALHMGEIDRGQFAIHNSVGGIVEESIHAMAKYKFNILGEFAIKISHALMVRKDINFGEITTIMSHPQVFAQCKQTLMKKYPDLKQISGERELIDHAMVAKYLSENKLGKHIATMGSRVLAELYDLKIIEDNLQDAKENYTSFLSVGRYES